MSRGRPAKPGDVVGGWTISEEFLGSGGNGTVWQVERDGQIGALKLLKRRRDGSEPSRRFEREIREHRRLSDSHVIGVLPVLDSVDLGDDGQLQLWIVTARAEKMRDVLPELSIEDRVDAIASIARTLARLHEQGVAHRDIKPDNLFRRQGQWFLGDFGLVDTDDEDQPAITEAGRPVGPRHFMAPEMIANPSAAVGAPADVYSLAKTLWVALTGQTFPLPGAHEPYEPLVRLASFVEHPRLGPLDLLIANATRLRPDQRPTVDEFARELRLWQRQLESKVPVEAHDLEALRTRWAQLAGPGVELQDARAAIQQHVADACAKLQAALGAIQEAYTGAELPAPVAESCEIISAWTAIRRLVLIGREDGQPTGSCVRLTHVLPQTSGFVGGGERWVSLHSGFAVRRLFDGTLYVGVGHVICQYDRSPYVVFDLYAEAKAGSATLEHAIRDLINQLSERLPEAFDAFLQRVAELDG